MFAPLVFPKSASYAINNSVYFVPNAYFSRAAGGNGSTRRFLFDGWVKLSLASGDQTIFSAYSGSGSGNDTIYYSGTNFQFRVNLDGGGTYSVVATPLLRDVTGWGHLRVEVDLDAVDTVKIFWNRVQLPTTGTKPNAGYSLVQFNKAGTYYIGYSANATYGPFSGYLANTLIVDGSIGSQDDTTTIDADGFLIPKSPATASLYHGYNESNGASASTYQASATAYVFTGFAIDNDETVLGFTVNNTENYSGVLTCQILLDNGSNNFTVVHSENFTFDNSGYQPKTFTTPYTVPASGTYRACVYFADRHSIHGSTFSGAYKASAALVGTETISAGPIQGPPCIVRYQGSLDGVGTNGVFLRYENSGALGTDSSGLGNTFTVNSTITQTTDSPTNKGTSIGNFATLNPLWKLQCNLSDGNIGYSLSAASGVIRVTSTFTVPMNSMVYFEITPTALAGSNGTQIGLYQSNTELNDNTASGKCRFCITATGQKTQNGDGSSLSSYGSAITTSDTVKVAIDGPNGKIYIGTIAADWFNSGDPVAGTGFMYDDLADIDWLICLGTPNASSTNTGTINFGQKAFVGTPPTGFKALCTANLPEPTIKDPSDHFATVLYNGTGAVQSITGLNFQPDLVWIKRRNVSSTKHNIFDSVRGATKILESSTTDAEATVADTLTSFDANGFSLGADAGGEGVNVSTSSSAYVAWCWKAGGAGASNTDGSITATVSANPTAGFSIVTWTGTGAAGTIGHGLGLVPKFIIIKSRSAVSNWGAYHASLGPTKALQLSSTAAAATSTAYWNDTAPSSSVFTVGSASDHNQSGQTFVAYVWAEVPGFSKFGSYAGNSSADGPFVEFGFSPEMILVKNSSGVYYWQMTSSTQNPNGNGTTYSIYPNAADQEGNEQTSNAIDRLANGMKLRGTGNQTNTGTHVYAAFAEHPFKSRKTQARAR